MQEKMNVTDTSEEPTASHLLSTIWSSLLKKGVVPFVADSQGERIWRLTTITSRVTSGVYFVRGTTPLLHDGFAMLTKLTPPPNSSESVASEWAPSWDAK